DWPIEFVSENVEMLTGYTDSEFMEGKISYTNLIYKNDIDRVTEEVISNSRLKKAKSIIHAPYRITAKNGHIKWIADKTFIRRKSDNSISHYEGIVTDITKEREMEEQLLQASRMEVVGTLAGGVAHDFNTLLGIILGYGEMVLNNISPDSQNKDYLLEIMRAGNRSRELVQDLMDFSIPNIESRKYEEFANLIEKSLPLLNSSFTSVINIKYKTLADTSTIFANSSQIQQVVMNIGMNAAQAMGSKGGDIEIILNETFINENLALSMNVKKGNFLKLVISDTGQGMDSNTVKHIFEPFYTSKPIGEGTGLGLSIVYGIIKSHDGFIKVYSKQGEGSTFKIYLPKI
ncbi:MAG: PAS domain-containing protein, partial [Spirochaetales bacterium]|nr:PAS domain-containing protein [Spirochaetales bacterium]